MTALDVDVDAEKVADRVLQAALGTVDLLAVYLGDRLGWYRSLADDGPATAAQLAARTGTSPRYAREWLEQQATTGLLDVDDPAAQEPSFRLPPAAAEVLTDERSLSYLAPLARMLGGAAVLLPALVEAYRSGTGVSWAQFGTDARESQADMNRPWYEQQLAGALRSVPALAQVLDRPGARVADIGCGAGWSSIALARDCPGLTVLGIDLDAASIDLCERNADQAGISDRVTFRRADAAELPAAEYDLVLALECVHDMPRPVEVLAAARRALVPGGSVVVMDEAVAEAFAPPGDDLERLMYGFSLLICLPDGMAHPPSAGTGTVMRPATLRRYALEAGFADVQVLPIDDFGFWRFYRLVP